MPGSWEELVDTAQREVASTVNSLPADLKIRAESLPIIYERVPSRELIEDGLEPDLLGLFVGPEFVDEEHGAIPSQIFLFLENIWAMVDGDEEEFRFEVRTTLMHELGHYLGLTEVDLDERGLL